MLFYTKFYGIEPNLGLMFLVLGTFMVGCQIDMSNSHLQNSQGAISCCYFIVEVLMEMLGLRNEKVFK